MVARAQFALALGCLSSAVPLTNSAGLPQATLFFAKYPSAIESTAAKTLARDIANTDAESA
jgi:hypothetical protein